MYSARRDATIACEHNFEHYKVRMLLVALDLPEPELKRHVTVLREAGRQLGDDGYLSFRALYSSDRFKDCPVRLDAQTVASSFGSIGVHYFLRFENTVLYNLYFVARHNSRLSDDRPFGLVVNVSGVRGGVIIHDAVLPGLTHRTALVCRSTNPDDPPEIILEPYRAFLPRLVKHWSDGARVRITDQRAEIAPRLERWMVKRLGAGPAAVVKAWLQGAWWDPHKRHVTVRAGAACLCVTQALIAKKSGLGADSVKRGLAALKKEGLITTVRGDRRTYVSLSGMPT